MSSTLSNLIYHVVFSTKNRGSLIDSALQPELYDCISGVVNRCNGILLKIGGIEDHVHLVMKLRTDIALSEIVRTVKSNSSKWLNERQDATELFAWQRGYGAFTVSASKLPALLQYVQNQKDHHKKMSFKEEYEAFLARNNIAYENDQLWS